MEIDKLKDSSRTTVLALLQLVPFPGPGAIAQVVEHFWKPSSERKFKEALDQFQIELERLGANEAAIWDKVNEDETTQLLLSDTGLAVRRTVSKKEREGLGRLLARGLCSTDRELIDIDYLLLRWSDLDAVEKLIFAMYGEASSANRSPALEGSAFEDGYFSGASHNDRMYKDTMHRLRMDRLLASGLIRPAQSEKWREGKLGYQFQNFILSQPGKILYDLMRET